MAGFYSKIIGSGSYLPRKVISNDELVQLVDTSSEWIIQRTGIKKRHVIDDGESTTTMALEAVKSAFNSSSIDPNSVEAIIFATTTPDLTFPSCASTVQKEFGCFSAAAFDIQAACCGFVTALSVSHALIVAKKYKRTLVIGSDSMSKLIDWKDRNTCVLFGDGAGCVLLEASESSGIVDFHLLSDGRLKDKLFTSGGLACDQMPGVIKMDGKSVFQNAVTKMSESISCLLKAQSLNITQVDAIISHQANIRIVESLARKLDFDITKMIITVDQHANTSAASIPLAIDFAIKEGKIKKGHTIVLSAIGAGLSWGSVLIKM